MHERLSLFIWVGHVHEHAPRRISALFIERKSVNDRGSPSGCTAGDRSAFAETIPVKVIPSTRRGWNFGTYAGYPLIRRKGDAYRRRGWVQHGGRASSRETLRQVQPLQLARSSASYWKGEIRTADGRHDPAADCRRTSSYEKLALPLPPLTVPKTRSSAGLSSLFLSSNLSLRPLALVLYHRSTPSLRAFAIRGGVLFSAEGVGVISLSFSFSFSFLFSFFLSAPMQGSLLLLRMESRTGPGDIFGFFFRYVVLRLARSHPV